VKKTTRRKEKPTSSPKKKERIPRDYRPLVFSLLSGLLMWCALPPLNFWPLAWVAPVGLLMLIRLKNLPGRRPYLAIYLAGFLHWMLVMHFLRLPHWTGYFGWLLISIYLGAMFPLLVGLTRVAVHRFRIGPLLAAPVVWVGMELARGYLFTGFSMALLGHTQVAWIELIQIADIFGAYGVSFVVMFAAVCIARMLPCDGQCRQLWPAIPLVGVLAVVLFYGYQRTRQTLPIGAQQRVLKVALIQGNYKTIFDNDLERSIQRNKESFADYLRRSLQARNAAPDLDLIVWPESIFTTFETLPEGQGELYLQDTIVGENVEPQPRSAWERGDYLQFVEYKNYLFEQHARKFAQQLNRPRMEKPKQQSQIAMLLGAETVHFEDRHAHRYNSAILLNPEGKLTNRYYKMHRVLFGEYIPFGNLFPWVYKLSPMGEGLTAGTEPKAIAVKGFQLSPSICFESTVPHLIRRQVVQLRAQGSPPDMLVNITNDGWFHGSNCLDLHLTCNVFRAVENRLPMLVAANTGLSASIDGNGRIDKKGPRQKSAFLISEVQTDGRTSYYQYLGDWPAVFCLAVCFLLAVMGLRDRIQNRPSDNSNDKASGD